MNQPGEGPRDGRKTTAGLFLGGDMEISPPPEVPPLARPVAKPPPRTPSPSRQLPVMRGSSTRPTIRHEAPERGGLDDTTKIVAGIALGVVALGVVALLMMGGRATPRMAETLPAAKPADPPPAVEAPRPAPVNTVTRLAPPPPRDPAKAPANLLPNASFEQVVDGKPVSWQVHNYNGAPVFSLAPGAGRRGGNAVCISSATGADAKWFVKLTVKPNTTYLMKGWAKCENISGPGRGVQFNMEPNDFRSDEIKGTSDWKLLQFTFETREQDNVEVNCLYGGWGQSTGTAWFDEVEVIELFSGK